MFAWLFKRRLIDAEIELRRIRHTLEKMERDAIARGILLNEINNKLNGKVEK